MAESTRSLRRPNLADTQHSVLRTLHRPIGNDAKRPDDSAKINGTRSTVAASALFAAFRQSLFNESLWRRK